MDPNHDAELAFAEQNRLALAMIAYEQYQKRGRGVLLIPSGVVTAPPMEVSKLGYATLHKLKEVGIERCLSQRDLSFIRDYDPSSSYVVIFMRGGENGRWRVTVFGFEEVGVLRKIYGEYKDQLSRGEQH